MPTSTNQNKEDYKHLSLKLNAFEYKSINSGTPHTRAHLQVDKSLLKSSKLLTLGKNRLDGSLTLRLDGKLAAVNGAATTDRVATDLDNLDSLAGLSSRNGLGDSDSGAGLDGSLGSSGSSGDNRSGSGANLVEGGDSSRGLSSSALLLLSRAVGDRNFIRATVCKVGASIELSVAGTGGSSSKVCESGTGNLEGACVVSREFDGLSGNATEGSGEALEVAIAGNDIDDLRLLIDDLLDFLNHFLDIVVSSIVIVVVVVVVVVVNIVVSTVSSAYIDIGAIRALGGESSEANVYKEIGNRLAVGIDRVVERSGRSGINSVGAGNCRINERNDTTEALSCGKVGIRAYGRTVHSKRIEVLLSLDKNLCSIESTREVEGSDLISKRELRQSAQVSSQINFWIHTLSQALEPASRVLMD